MLKQSLQQKLLQKLSPQQIQLMKLLQLPTTELEVRIKEELEAARDSWLSTTKQLQLLARLLPSLAALAHEREPRRVAFPVAEHVESHLGNEASNQQTY